MRILVSCAIAGVIATASTGELGAQQDRASVSATERMRLAAADSAYNDGNRMLAQRYYAAVLELNPKNSRAVYQLGQLSGEKAAEAIAFFRQYVALEPRDAWGYIALARALARVGELDEALAQMDAARRVAPSERDVWVGRARILAQANRTDAAIMQYERWTSLHPTDAEAWRELAAQRSKAGRIDGALDALEKAQAHQSTPAAERRLRRLRALAAPWTEPAAGGSRDSDGNQTGRVGLTIGSTVGDGVGIDGHGVATHVGDAGAAATVYDLGVGARWRPMATLRAEAHGGMAVSDSVLPGAQRAQPTGDLRLDWRAASGRAALGLRASRAPIAASPALVRNNVVRDEIGGRADLSLVGPLRIRALARDGLITSALDRNTRVALGGGVVLAGSLGELSVTMQQIAFAHATVSGYFSPRSARVVEGSTYIEHESDNGIRLSLDLGAGAQRVTEWGLPAGGWGPAYHTWGELALPLADGSELRFELESYNSRIGEIATNGTWRYLSMSVLVHWALP
jgi:tetratricopeptide (TPR) repeat protein